MTAWRFRRCLSCGHVAPGGDFKPVRYGEPSWSDRPSMMRRCLACGCVGTSARFPVVKIPAPPSVPAGSVRKAGPAGRSTKVSPTSKTPWWGA